MQARFLTSIEAIDPASWDALVRDNNPFLKHAFHRALERHGCVAEHYGWRPNHLVLSHNERIVGVSPLYVKRNSYGEFVFDYSWADAYQQSGLAYYPKLISALPYTPATGERLLIDSTTDRALAVRTMVEATLEWVRENRCSSMHWLFTTEQESEELESLGMMQRLGVQFHWENQGYGDFAAFLDRLSAKRRKNIRRERRKVAEQGFQFRLLSGSEATPQQWRLFDEYYRKTFEERASLPTLNLGFFQEIGESLGDQVLLVLAYRGRSCLAGALLYRSDHVLYGRHWGGVGAFDSLHFETCYYQGIDYAISQGIERFEPGAQGEHKIWRGFLPTLTRSNHWIADRRFRPAIEDFLRRETLGVEGYMKILNSSSPYRSGV
ncbi:MAG: GNAT family N-acetyltransferase [Candidatus Thiodiazotropha sp.]